MDFGGNPYTLEHLETYAEIAEQTGFRALSANDHLVFSVPWLDGPTALAAVMGRSQSLELACDHFATASKQLQSALDEANKRKLNRGIKQLANGVNAIATTYESISPSLG